METYQPNRACRCARCLSRGVMGPVVLITLGVLFLLSEFAVASFGRTWPILLIIIGLVKVLGSTAGTSGHPPPPSPPGSLPPPQPDDTQKQVEHV